MKKIWTFIVAILLLLTVLPLISACKGYIIPAEKTVKYSQFGATGDGVTDDFAAICATHEYANQNGVAVSADKGATYYIGCAEDENKTHEKSAIIKTNTYWLDAKFIIDDKDIATDKIKNADIFVVKSDKKEEKLKIPEGYTLKAGQRNIGFKFDEPKLVYIVNSEKKDFIRSGVDENKGTNRQEVVLVNKLGYVDSSTPITWDYSKVTSMIAYPVTENKLTVSGGEFVTIEKIPYMSYVNRGLLVTRANVLVKGVKHSVTGESADGSSYSGFFRAQRTTNVTFEKCQMWGRYTPIRSNGLTQGTYDIQATLANDITWRNCTQGNSIKEGWGVMGSNHSRNLKMIGCVLSRFDAHQGVYNATIKNCTLNTISVVGFGTLHIENVTRDCLRENDYGETDFLVLRADYGAFWRGKIVLKNCTMNTNAAINYLIKINHNYNWDYGYQCYMPTKVVVDNVVINYTGGRKAPYPYFYVFSNLDLTRTLTPQIWEGLDPNNRIVFTKRVVLKNCSEKYLLTHNQTGLLDNVKFTLNGKRIKPQK